MVKYHFFVLKHVKPEGDGCYLFSFFYNGYVTLTNELSIKHVLCNMLIL